MGGLGRILRTAHSSAGFPSPTRKTASCFAQPWTVSNQAYPHDYIFPPWTHSRIGRLGRRWPHEKRSHFITKIIIARTERGISCFLYFDFITELPLQGGQRHQTAGTSCVEITTEFFSSLEQLLWLFLSIRQSQGNEVCLSSKTDAASSL